MSVIAQAVPPEAVSARVTELAAAIEADFAGKEPVLLGILQGAVPFLADLTRHLTPRVDIDFLSLTRFGSEGRVAISATRTCRVSAETARATTFTGLPLLRGPGAAGR